MPPGSHGNLTHREIVVTNLSASTQALLTPVSMFSAFCLITSVITTNKDHTKVAPSESLISAQLVDLKTSVKEIMLQDLLLVSIVITLGQFFRKFSMN